MESISNIKNYCTIYIVRHGQTDWNVKKLIQGHMDIPLNEKGMSQAKKINNELKGINFDKIYSSDLKRAYKTAKIIAQDRKLKNITSKDLRERDFGNFVGKTFKGNPNLDKFIDDLKRKSKTKEIETDRELMKRFINFLKKVSAENSEKTILIVSHAGPMRTFLVKLGWGTYENLTEGCIDNLAFIKLQSRKGRFTVNETFGIIKKK